MASVLDTPYGSSLTTPACVTTPLMPVYLAGAVFPATRRERVLAVAAFVPLSGALSLARLLTLVLPPAWRP